MRKESRRDNLCLRVFSYISLWCVMLVDPPGGGDGEEMERGGDGEERGDGEGRNVDGEERT